jgi:2-polyprenyl-3-methyl-5-hydroxy-6-metoxy-1,4-benzoquinol methylase
MHWLLCLGVCLPFRLDAVLAYLGANISNPVFAPLLFTLEIEIGALLLTGDFAGYAGEESALRVAGDYASFLVVGGVVLGTLLGAPLGALAFVIARRRERRVDPFEITRRRYAAAPRADRGYIASKLEQDPLFDALLELDAPLGSVVDAGCGRGQLGLFLLDQGRADRVQGFDWDARKVELARAAAAGAPAEFRVAELQTAALSPCDTLLLVDVLHYLEPAQQSALVERAVTALSSGGRLLLRDIDAAGGRGARLAMTFERWGCRLGMNRAAGLHFRPISEHRQLLERLGLSVRALDTGAGGLLANVLLVAEKVAERDEREPHSGSRNDRATPSSDSRERSAYPADSAAMSSSRAANAARPLSATLGACPVSDAIDASA